MSGGTPSLRSLDIKIEKLRRDLDQLALRVGALPTVSARTASIESVNAVRKELDRVTMLLGTAARHDEVAELRLWVEARLTMQDKDTEIQKLTAQKDAAYGERNRCVAFICKMAQELRWPVWRGLHDPADTTWENGWRHIIFVQAPTGQLSWHIHDSELPLFAWIEATDPENGQPAAWDGHSTEEKYERMRSWDP